jgi:ABC-2 type transport system permease protein
MNTLRIFVLGGLTSYRAMFGWLTPWILIPSFLLVPLFQILFFAYVGRAAGAEDDSFFLIGNSLLNAALPGLFATSITIGGERGTGTLPLLLASPARRLPLFLGRALPIVLNGFAVTAFALIVGALALNVVIPAPTWGGLALVIAVSSVSCTGLGLVVAAIALRVRETLVLSNIIFGLLIIFAGVNVPVDAMPGWTQVVSDGIPLTRGIQAAHQLAAGHAVADVAGLIVGELAVGVVYGVIGLMLLRLFEWESRRLSTLDDS